MTTRLAALPSGEEDGVPARGLGDDDEPEVPLIRIIARAMPSFEEVTKRTPVMPAAERDPR